MLKNIIIGVLGVMLFVGGFAAGNNNDYSYLRENSRVESATIISFNNDTMYFKTTDGNVYAYNDTYYVNNRNFDKTVTIYFDTNRTVDKTDDIIVDYWFN